MKSVNKSRLKIKPYNVDEPIPYELLLLADETIDVIDKYIFQSALFGLEDEGKVIAIYALLKLNETEIEIKNIAVAELYQGQGIGTFLLEDATKRAKESGYKRLIIGTTDVGFRQIKLYEKNGFVAFDVKKDFFILNYANPIFENGCQLRDMVMLKKELYV